MDKEGEKWGAWCSRASLPPVGRLRKWPKEGAAVAPIIRNHERYKSLSCKRLSPWISSCFSAIYASLFKCRTLKGVQSVTDRDIIVYCRMKESDRKQLFERVFSQQQVRIFVVFDGTRVDNLHACLSVAIISLLR